VTTAVTDLDDFRDSDFHLREYHQERHPVGRVAFFDRRAEVLGEASRDHARP